MRTHDDGHPECAISGQGELPGYGTFSGPGELAEKLVASGELSDCSSSSCSRTRSVASCPRTKPALWVSFPARSRTPSIR